MSIQQITNYDKNTIKYDYKERKKKLKKKRYKA